MLLLTLFTPVAVDVKQLSSIELMVEFLEFTGMSLKRKKTKTPLKRKVFFFVVKCHLQISGFSQVGKSF